MSERANLVEIVLCHPVRTAIGSYNGSLKEMPAPRLGAAVIAATLARAGLAPEQVQTVVMGNVIAAGLGMNPARQAAVYGGVPVEVPALTVNRVCGSGAQAIVSAALEIWSGMIECAIAGGMENMDRAPYLMAQGRWGARMGDVTMVDSMLGDGLNDAFSGHHSGWHTEALVEKFGLSRARQDHWAWQSQQRFAAAQAAGKFAAEIVPLELPGKKGPVCFERDEGNRPETTLEGLARLAPAFRPGGTITAGNSPGLNSGAAAMLVAERGWAERHGLTPLARLVAYGVGAVEPDLFGLGPLPAVRQALARANWEVGMVERVEINEAFGAVTLVCAEQLGFAEEIVNIDGGAIALGHPIGATGAVLATRLMHGMQRDGMRRGIVTLCIGGGQGIALALERI